MLCEIVYRVNTRIRIRIQDSFKFVTSSFTIINLIQNVLSDKKILELTVDYNFSPGEVSVNHSFICRSSITTNNVTATIGSDTYGPPVTSTLKNIQMQAFNKIKNEKNFAECKY